MKLLVLSTTQSLLVKQLNCNPNASLSKAKSVTLSQNHELHTSIFITPLKRNLFCNIPETFVSVYMASQRLVRELRCLCSRRNRRADTYHPVRCIRFEPVNIKIKTIKTYIFFKTTMFLLSLLN